MQVIAEAGIFTPSDGTEPNHWVVHFDNADLTVGTYSIAAGGLDDQSPHTEDEIYVIQSGRATLVTTSGIADVGPGSVVFVPAGEAHKFTEVTEDLALLVIFAPRYESRTAGEPIPTLPPLG